MSNEDFGKFFFTSAFMAAILIFITSITAEAHGWRRYECIESGYKPPANMFLTDCGVSLKKEGDR